MQTAPPLPNPQMFEDANHLRYLAIGHYVSAALTGIFSSIFVIHIVMGGMMISSSGPFKTMPPDSQMMGWLFMFGGAIAVLIGWGMAVLMFLTVRWLSARKRPTFCFVVACIECIHMPLGTILGVFTILVLNRPSVRALFVAPPDQNNWTR